MTESRYQYSDIISEQENNDKNKFYQIMSTFPTIRPEEIESEHDEFETLNAADRLDTIAYRHYGDASLWWVICLANGLNSPFDKSLTPGKVLKIPGNVERVLMVIKIKSRKAF